MQQHDKPGLAIQSISKTYSNGVKALDHVSLTIPYGMYGLLGPNGAGKSTLMRILSTLQDPDEGSIYLDDLNLLRDKESVRSTLGYLPQDFGLPNYISAEKLLMHLAILKGVTNNRKEVVQNLLMRTNLWQKRKHAVSGFSGGMRQRFGIAAALLGKPRLVIVDEPTAGLDPDERVRFLNLLSELGEQSVVILSSHIVADIAELCTAMAIINKGKILLEDTPQRACAQLHGFIWEKTVGQHELDAYGEQFNIVSKKRSSGQTRLHVYAPVNPGEGFHLATPDLEDVYFCTIGGYFSYKPNTIVL